MDEKKFYVRGCVKRIEQESTSPLVEQQSGTTSPAVEDGSESPSLVSGRKRSYKVPDVISPAKPKGSYEPSQYPWYPEAGHTYPWKVRSGFDGPFPEPPCIWKYNKDEQWLCGLPEGYSRTATMLFRQKTLEKAYYYSYNNLSSSEGNRPGTSRAYFSTYPFTCDEHLLEAEDVQNVRSVDYSWKPKASIATGRVKWSLPDGSMTRPFGPTRARWLEYPSLAQSIAADYRLPPENPRKHAFVG